MSTTEKKMVAAHQFEIPLRQQVRASDNDGV